MHAHIPRAAPITSALALFAVVVQVLAAVAFRALYQATELPAGMASTDVAGYREVHPPAHQPKKQDSTGKEVSDGPLQLSSLIFEALDGGGRDRLRAEFSEIETMLTDYEDEGKQGTPQHSYLCKRPESILRTCVPSEGIVAALDSFRSLDGYTGLTLEFARQVVAEHDAMADADGKRVARAAPGFAAATPEFKNLYHVKPSGEVRRTISKPAADLAIRFVTAASEVQDQCTATAAQPLNQLESTLMGTPSACLQEKDMTQKLRLSRTLAWRSARRLEELGLAIVLSFSRPGQGRARLLLLKRPVALQISEADPSPASKLELSGLLGSLSPAISLSDYQQALQAAPVSSRFAPPSRPLDCVAPPLALCSLAPHR